MAKQKKKLPLPSNCPICGDSIKISQINCKSCDISINGNFSLSDFSLLPIEYQKFIMVFLHYRGNIKAVEKELGISYPTINRILDSINNLLKFSEEQTPPSRKEILDAIDKGQMSVKDATIILKNQK